MPKFSRCPACGAPLPARWGLKGVTCEYCGSFLPRDILDEGVPHQDPDQGLPRMFTPGQEPQAEQLPPSTVEQNTFQIDPADLRPSVPTKPRRSGMRAFLVIGIIIVLVLCCLACSTLLLTMENLSDPFRNFFPR